jgi:hypothetical protein
MRSSILHSTLVVFSGTCALLAGSAWADRTEVLRSQAQIARRPEGALRFDGPRRLAGGGEQSLTCFEDALTTVINPGCFMVTGGGNCTSRASHYFVQYIFPSVTTTHRVIGFGFISNDGQTVFPGAGVLTMPDQPPGLRFPTSTELQNLQATNVPTPGDTSVVFVDLEGSNIQFGPNQALVICLRFPEGGTLMGPGLGVGPGIAANDSIPDQDCDYFTLNSGANWYIPDPQDPEPLDWGFEVVYEETSPVEGQTWTGVKSLFVPIAKPVYREP